MAIDQLINLMAHHGPGAANAYLVSNRIDLNQPDPTGSYCPLTWAVEHGNETLARMLLDHGADPDFHAEFDGPPLGLAIEYAIEDWDLTVPHQGVPSLGMVKLLTEHGADPHKPWTKDGSTPLDWAIHYGFDQAVSFFVRLDWQRRIMPGAAVDVEGLIWLGRGPEARTLVESDHPDLNQAGSSGYTPLETAIQIADNDMVGFLVQRGADPNSVSPSGMTPLASAMRFSLERWDYGDHRDGRPSTSIVDGLVRLGASSVVFPPGGMPYEKLYKQAQSGRQQQERADYYDDNGLLRYIAVMDADVDGAQFSGTANSGRVSKRGSVGVPAQPQLPTHTTGDSSNPRDTDPEIKLLEGLLRRTTPDSTGHVTLISERDPCDSCLDAIKIFENLRKRIALEISFQHPYPPVPATTTKRQS